MSAHADLQDLMAMLPDECAPGAAPALARQLERIANALEALAGIRQPAAV